MKLFKATDADAPAIVALRNAVAARLTQIHGRGHWSSCVAEKAVLRELRSSEAVVAKVRGSLVGTVRLSTKKPWAIDLRYFSGATRPLYLHALAVAPPAQRQGIGRLLIEAAKSAARAWPADALRLDAYDHVSGAGQFYAKCGFREVGQVVYRNVPLIYFELLL